MPIANPKTNTVPDVTYRLIPARYVIDLPIDTLYAANGRELDLLMNDPRVTKFQPQQVRIRIVYE